MKIEEPKNIIVRMPNWVGDLVMATPILTDLRKKFPKTSITAMCKMPTCSLLKEDRDINELFCFVKPKNEFLRRRELSNIVQKIKRGDFDLGILLTNSFPSAWWFWLGNVKVRVGFKDHFRSLLLNAGIPFPKKREQQHLVLTYKELLKPLGIEPSNTVPRIFLTEKELNQTKELLYQRGYKDGKQLIGINATSAYGPAKCWPKGNFEKLAKMLLQRDDLYVVFFGDSSAIPIVKEICRELPQRAINLAGSTTLRELACIIKGCDLLITNDSGPMHIAAALNVPLLALFGSSCEIITGPYKASEESVINKHLSCAPCFKRRCISDYLCLRSISVEEVFVKVQEIMKW